MDCVYSIVDLHAITVFQDPKKLEKSIMETVSSFIACGLDSKKSIIFFSIQFFNCIRYII